MKRTVWFALLAVLALSMTLAACGRRATRGPVLPAPEGVLAVAGFTAPQYTWELMAGYLPVEGQEVSRSVLNQLDDQLFSVLAEHAVVNYMNPAVVAQCEEVVEFEQTSTTRTSAFQYWIEVGRCVPADWLLVPQVLYWRDREGSEAGVTKPASVIIDLFLIDVKNARLAGRYHFDETQQALSDNLLEAQQFADRGGRWISGAELAREGIDAGLLELGL